MKKLILILFIPLVSFSQDYLVFVKDKSYRSSEGFRFDNEYDDLIVSFVKTDNGDAIHINTLYIIGDTPVINKPLTLFLANGDVIISKSASVTDYVDRDCISIYPLTADDISALKQHDLVGIRFTITQTYASGGEKDVNREIG